MSVVDRTPGTAQRAILRAVVDLDDPDALQPVVVGAKAAALASARAGGFPVAPGFVVATSAVDRLARERDEVLDQLRPAWAALTGDGTRALIVRSSSMAEDQAATSMAGHFETVPDVRSWPAFRTAVEAVAESAEGHPMAVLVQPMVDARVAGVLFGIDPVSGREDRLVLASVDGHPGDLVGGEVEGNRYVLDRSGRVLHADRPDRGARVGRAQRRALALLAARLAGRFGGPQDVEWAFDHTGELWLFQSRPVTTERRGTPGGPLLGPGPVAETFPDPLSALEEDLWLAPLRHGIAEALLITGSTSRRHVARSPIVVSINGRVAADLDLLGEAPPGSWARRAFSFTPRFRRLLAAWRVGRLRAALPALARDLVARADDELAEVGGLHELSDTQLLDLLDRSGQALASLHGHEVLLGSLAEGTSGSLTGAGAALRRVAADRRAGLDDDEIVRRHPVVLALVPPRVGPPVTQLPDVTATPDMPDEGSPNDPAVLREALRVRARWVQELTARVAWELAQRLAARGDLRSPEHVRALGLDHLRSLVVGGEASVTVTLADTNGSGHRADEPLPATFRLGDRGVPIPFLVEGTADGGTGAGGGTATGVVHDDPATAPPGSILVVGALTPRLAPALVRVAGLVSETGSVLSHAAILARESGVATVVAVSGATRTYPVGSTVTVDGHAGTVTLVAEGSS